MGVLYQVFRVVVERSVDDKQDSVRFQGDFCSVRITRGVSKRTGVIRNGKTVFDMNDILMNTSIAFSCFSHTQGNVAVYFVDIIESNGQTKDT